MAPQHSEEDLPRLLATDLKQYIGPFVKHYWSFVKKQAFQLTRNDEEAEDLRQNVFECVLRALERKSAEQIEHIKFQGYLRSTTAHCYINMHRRKHGHIESLDTEDGAEIQENLADSNVRERQPEMAYEDKEFRCEIAELLNNLPSQQGVAVMLKYGWGYSYHDVAQALHVSEKLARDLVQRGKKKLKETASA